MKRVKQIFLFLLILLLCSGYAFWKSDLHLSPEAAMAAEEWGLRYGPSEEILLTYEKENGDHVYVGRWEKGLSVVCLEPKWGIFWKSANLTNGYMHCLPTEKPVEAFLSEENYIVGLSGLPEAAEVICKLYSYDESRRETVFVREVTMEVSENGFFYGETALPETEYGYNIAYVEARNRTGETVYIRDENV